MLLDRFTLPRRGRRILYSSSSRVNEWFGHLNSKEERGERTRGTKGKRAGRGIEKHEERCEIEERKEKALEKDEK